MDSPFILCREEDGYQQRLAALLVEVRRRSAVLTLAATDLLCFTEDLWLLYYVADRSYWAKEFHFEAPVRDRQGLLAGWQNVGLFSMRVSDHAKHYCQVPSL